MRYHIVYVRHAHSTNWMISHLSPPEGFGDLNQAMQERERANQTATYEHYVYRVVEEAELKTLGLR